MRLEAHTVGGSSSLFIGKLLHCFALRSLKCLQASHSLYHRVHFQLLCRHSVHTVLKLVALLC
jgi:hypothetical protein